MPDRMSREDFERWRRRRKRWALLLDTSEALILLVTAMWGLQLLWVASPHVDEPISKSLLQVWPHVPLPFHGAGLIAVALVHLSGMKLDNTGLRRRMIMAQLLFFLYVEFSLVLAHIVAPGVFIVPAYILGCIVNYFSLVRPPESVGGEQAGPCRPAL
jgi:hypothetical protein